MPAREPLTEKERQQIQWAYHKGTKARKQVIQELFGRHITHASCMAMVDQYVREDEFKGIAKAVAKPSEDELWDWLCCAAFHGHVWSQEAKGNIRDWTEVHCQAMGESHWEEERPEMFEKHRVPEPIPSTWRIRAYLLLRNLPKIWREVLGAIGIVWVLERVQEVVISLSGKVP